MPQARHLAREIYTEKLWAVVERRVPPDRRPERHAMSRLVREDSDIGKRLGFTTEADLGLFLIALACCPSDMADGEIGRWVSDPTLDFFERRYRLKRHLHRAGVLEFNAHESH